MKPQIKSYGQYKLPVSVFIFTFLLMAMVQLHVKNPIILLERFVRGAGWVEITVLAFYGALVAWKMQDPMRVPAWRRLTWTIFSAVFFGQLIIGLLGSDKFLMTGKLHLPIPTMILAGPLYRGHLSVMTILFLSTVILTGPAWCSQLCYFGALDSLASKGKTGKEKIKNKKAIKTTILLLVIGTTILLRWFNFSMLMATLTAIAFGVTGMGVMMLVSCKKGKMVHCTLYCPIGTTVSLLKPVNPFRMYIDNACTLCLKCTGFCKYDALSLQDLRNKKPGFGCTYCGDCLAACRDKSIKYRFFKLNHETSRLLYLFLTVSLHTVFLAMARI
jgi:ferredoxin-type protein NapH